MPRVLAVGLHRHGRQCRLDVSRLDQHDLEPGRGHPSVQPLGERPGFQADANDRQPEIGQEADQGLWLTRDLAFAHDPSRRVHHAHAAGLQGDIDTGIVFHDHPSLMLASLTGQ